VMMRGTFANVRIRNKITTKEGGYTTYFPTGETLAVYDAAMKYIESGTPLVVLAGKEYGSDHPEIGQQRVLTCLV